MTATERAPGGFELELRTRLVELTRDLIVFESSENRDDEKKRCALFIRNHLDSLEDVRVEDYSSDGLPLLVALPRDESRPEILLCAHLDVVAHAQSDAYRPYVEDGRIWGAGAGDMKGPLAICLALFQDLHRRHPGISLGFAVTADEEIGGERGVRRLIEEIGLSCGLAMIPDGGSLDEVSVAEKGIVHLELVFRYQGSSQHAARPWLAENPIENILRTAAELGARFGSLQSRSRPGDGTDHWYPTCTPTLLLGSNRSFNRIPSEARLGLDLRFPPPHTSSEMVAIVREIAGDRAELRIHVRAEPTESWPERLYVEIAEETTGRTTRFLREAGASDARFFRASGISVIVSRPEVGNIHARDEWIDIASMLTFYRIYERFILRKLDA